MTVLTETLIAYPPLYERGKWHAVAYPGVAGCGAPTPIHQSDLEGMRLQFEPGTPVEKIHPIVCRRCVKAASR